ncbi:MAG: DNA (cytosine-5-)-methyltransferase [Anaerolineales bacterium]
MTSGSIRAIDLFCGIGGNSWGARQAGVEIVAGFDKWDLAGKVFQDNFPEARFYNVDLAALRHADIEHFREELGPIDLILASPECTSHSVARGASPKNKASLRLSWNVLRFARVFQPRWVVIENVSQFSAWESYGKFLEIFRRVGYHFLEQDLVASDFGVPQSRRRLYILLDRKQPPRHVERYCEKPVSMRDIIHLNGDYRFSQLTTENRARKTLARAEKAIQVLGPDQPFVLVYYGSEIESGWLSLDEPLRTVTTHDRFALVKPDGQGNYLMRMLQPPELQAAMGFPPEFRLSASLTRGEKIHLLGNAVCPPVMQAIVKTLVQK